MTYVSLALGLLNLVNMLVKWAEREGYIDTDRRAQLALALTEISRSAKVAKDIEMEVAQQTPEEILRQLEGDFRD